MGLDTHGVSTAAEICCPGGAIRESTGATTAVEHSAKSHWWAGSSVSAAAALDSSLTVYAIVIGLKIAHSIAALCGSMSAAASTVVGRMRELFMA